MSGPSFPCTSLPPAPEHLKTSSDRETMANCDRLGIGSGKIIRLCRNSLRLPGQIIVPGEHWFGSASHCGINWRRSDAAGSGARAFGPSIGCPGCYVVVVAGRSLELASS
jgi:hypothetical protein